MHYLFLAWVNPYSFETNVIMCDPFTIIRFYPFPLFPLTYPSRIHIYQQALKTDVDIAVCVVYTSNFHWIPWIPDGT